jgi:hypothetical protein
MRITHDTLMKIAGDTVARSARADRLLLGAYLCGSLLTEEVLLGGAADIDLVLIHTEPVTERREIVRLTDEVHLDIAHHYHRDYREPRSLRVHPWLGPTINACRVMYDPQHFLDFTQASVRGQFDRSDFVFERARVLAEQARQVWFSFQTGKREPGPDDILDYLRSIELSANSIALLSGPPLTERRFLLQFPERTEVAGKPGLVAGLFGLLGASNLQPGMLQDWLPAWERAFMAVPEPYAVGSLHPDRRFYYLAAFQALLQPAQTPQLSHPQAVLWPLLYRWSSAASRLPAGGPAQQEWQSAMAQLGLSGIQFAERIQALDAYLDTVDETLESWARANGAWEK